MPTNQFEANHILEIAKEYVDYSVLKELFIKLDENVGSKTTNDSLKQSLKMIRLLIDPPLPKPPFWCLPALWILITIHFILILGITMSFLILPFYTSWYIALPLCTFIWFFSSNRFGCKLTDLENTLRQRLGMKYINGFIGHYIMKPIKKRFTKKPTFN